MDRVSPRHSRRERQRHSSSSPPKEHPRPVGLRIHYLCSHPCTIHAIRYAPACTTNWANHPSRHSAGQGHLNWFSGVPSGPKFKAILVFAITISVPDVKSRSTPPFDNNPRPHPRPNDRPNPRPNPRHRRSGRFARRLFRPFDKRCMFLASRVGRLRQ